MFPLCTCVRSLSTTSFLLCLVVLYLVPVAINGVPAKPAYILIQSLTCDEYTDSVHGGESKGTWKSLGSLEECSDAGTALGITINDATQRSDRWVGPKKSPQKIISIHFLLSC